MKKTTFYFVVIGLLFVSCLGVPRNQGISLQEESNVQGVTVSTQADNVDNHVGSVRSSIFDMDTVIGRNRVVYYICEKEQISSDSVFDRSFFLSYSRNGQELIKEQEIQKYDFDSIVPRELLQGAVLWSCYTEHFDDNNCILSLNICAPDSDDCLRILLTIDTFGHLTAKREIILWDEDE